MTFLVSGLSTKLKLLRCSLKMSSSSFHLFYFRLVSSSWDQKYDWLRICWFNMLLHKSYWDQCSPHILHRLELQACYKFRSGKKDWDRRVGNRTLPDKERSTRPSNCFYLNALLLKCSEFWYKQYLNYIYVHCSILQRYLSCLNKHSLLSTCLLSSSWCSG